MNGTSPTTWPALKALASDTGGLSVCELTLGPLGVRGRCCIPYQVPDADHLTERLAAVLAVIYLLFNEGYLTSTGDVAAPGPGPRMPSGSRQLWMRSGDRGRVQRPVHIASASQGQQTSTPKTRSF